MSSKCTPTDLNSKFPCNFCVFVAKRQLTGTYLGEGTDASAAEGLHVQVDRTSYSTAGDIRQRAG